MIVLPHVFLAAPDFQTSHKEVARNESAEGLKIKPTFSLDRFASSHKQKFQHAEEISRIFAAAHQAGLPEE